MDKLGINWMWLAAQIVNFGVLLFLLWRFAYKPVLNMLETRKQKIQESLEYSDRLKREAEEQQKEFERKLTQAREEAKSTAAAAAQLGEKEREKIIAQAREEARQIVAQARDQIEYERKQMLSEVREQIVHLSLLATRKVVSKSLDERSHRKLVNDFLAQTRESR